MARLPEHPQHKAKHLKTEDLLALLTVRHEPDSTKPLPGAAISLGSNHPHMTDAKRASSKHVANCA
jgi:hypothetical protein